MITEKYYREIIKLSSILRLDRLTQIDVCLIRATQFSHGRSHLSYAWTSSTSNYIANNRWNHVVADKEKLMWRYITCVTDKENVRLLEIIYLISSFASVKLIFNQIFANVCFFWTVIEIAHITFVEKIINYISSTYNPS